MVETAWVAAMPKPRPAKPPKATRNCQGRLMKPDSVMPMAIAMQPPNNSTRAPKRSIRLPAIGDMTAMVTSASEPPLETKVRVQPKSFCR